ncbi:uncharacterized protein LOC116005772 [Ipomoea triloba]|uniref:uncharacterized protein LOC116005772 n=1 Tax=Ipomoea triloba TaxID=35885 RepID=UPI00125E139A|nr:uncharacterized protein LOC116005772 [Ipomoea triloba]
MKAITWNCQGAASSNFLRAAKWLKSKHHPDILYLVETKMFGHNADFVCTKFGFDKWARVEALGFSGGIWILWTDVLTIEVLNSHPQFVHLNITEASGRRNKVRVSNPWLIAGDFNAIVNEDECSNPENQGSHRNGDFRDWIFSEALIDLGYSGTKFTWRRGREEGTFKGARLDRALCSMDWLDQMKDTKVYHLTAFGSDHYPIMIDLDSKKEKGITIFSSKVLGRAIGRSLISSNNIGTLRIRSGLTKMKWL